MFRGIHGGFEAAVVAVALAFTAPPIALCEVWYVDSSAVAANDGSSWADAFVDLHDALGKAQAGDEVWIAGGVYRPDRGTGDRDMSFVVPDGVVLYGGFAGWETAPAERQLDENETVLSGDLGGDDGPQICEQVSDCCVAHDSFGCDDPLCEARVCAIDLECCDGMFDPKHFWDVSCAHLARRECCELAEWNRCENSALVGRITPGTLGVVLDGLAISSSYSAHGEGGAGLGAWASGAKLTLRECTLRETQGGGVLVDEAGSLDASNSDFVDNVGSAIVAGGFEAPVTVHRSRFLRNGGGIFAQSDLEVRDCLFDSNRGAITSRAKLTVVNTKFLRHRAQFISHDGGLASYVGCEFADNMGRIFEDNAVFRDCVFRTSSGAVSVGLGSVSLINCLVYGMPSSAFIGGSFRVTNCTVTGNGAAFSVGSIFEPNVTIDNSIIFGNEIPGLGYVFSEATVNHSVVEGWEGEFPGLGTFDADPLFVNPLGPDGLPGTEDDDYRLSADSPAINAGAMTASMPASDLDGHPRVLCGAVDIGAYEFGTGDPDCDGLIGPSDFQDFVACLLGPDLDYPPACLPFDADTSSAIDLSDFAFLQRAFNSQ